MFAHLHDLHDRSTVRKLPTEKEGVDVIWDVRYTVHSVRGGYKWVRVVTRYKQT